MPVVMLLLFVFLLFFLALGASIYWKFFILYPLLWGLAGMAFVAWRRGFSLCSIAGMGLSGARQASIVIKVLINVGALTAAWRASGVVCFLVYHGLQFLSPQYFLEGAFLFSAAFSFLIGTSLGTVSVLGIALIVIAGGGGLSVPMAAGAIVAGAFFGDRGSPMSSSAHLVAAVTHTDVYTNLKNMMYTACIPFFLSVLAYALLASSHGLSSFDPTFIHAIDQAFPRHPIMLVPPLIILVGSACRIRLTYIMPASTLSAVGICLGVQDQNLLDILGYLVTGYQPAVLTPATKLFAGGGWVSVIPAILIIFFSSAITGIFAGAHLLTEVEKTVARLYRLCGAYFTNLLVSTLASAAACNQTLAIILVNQLQYAIHAESPATRSRFALMLEDSVVMISALIPWNIAVSLPLAILDAEPSSILYAFYIWLIPLCGWFTPTRRKQHQNTKEST
ncbi:MAG: Na+/H+ antiporter NhaC family protein [Desulfovibrionaceae bacterium]